MPSYSIGVDLGGTNLRIAAVDERGTLLEKTTIGTQVSLGREVVIRDMVGAIRNLVSNLHGAGDLLGIGIGIPGIIDKDTGLLRESPNLPGWSDFPVAEEIQRLLGKPVMVENDANVAALGEKWLGAAREFKSMCMLTLGTGVGGGLVLDNKIWNGMNGMAGELGHLAVDPDGVPCNCGSHGCVEQYASATAVVRMAHEAIAAGKAPQLKHALKEHGEKFSAKVVYLLAQEGDEASQVIFEKVGSSLGIVIAAIINALNLPIFLVGGGVAAAWPVFAPAMFKEVKRRSFVYVATMPDPDAPQPQKKRTIIAQALLGSDAGLYGAARLPMLLAAEAIATK
jgi:glucokinase